MYIGINLPAKQRTPPNAVLDNGYDFITSRITSSSYRRKIQALVAASNGLKVPRVPPPFDEDLALETEEFVGQTVALAAPWCEIDAKDYTVAQTSLQVLLHEMEYAQFSGITYLIVPGPRRRTHMTRYAHSIAQLLRKAPKITILIHTTFTEDFTDTGLPPSDLLSTWSAWETVWTLCGSPENLKLALEVPSHQLPLHVVDRWISEAVGMLVISSESVFVMNAKNYPVLPKHTQQLMMDFFEYEPPFVLLKDIESRDDSYLIYMRHLITKSTQALENSYGKGLENTLQLPLQPQGDNLESATYEVFEKDLLKYKRYEDAILAAMHSLGAKELIVFVIGAGRGALVDRVLSAAKTADIHVIVHALEKNPGAIACLKSHQRTKWSDNVKVHIGDSRNWAPPHRADIIVSEMLGSFGDNELCPEALQALEHAREPSGLYVPSSHTSWIAPMFSPLLHDKCKQAGFGQPYVVYITKGQLLSELQPVWTFNYPNVEGFNRVARLSFPIKNSGTVHGFAGYFEATLFEGVELSTLPDTDDSPLSWFPMWFPLTIPLSAAEESEVELTIWRTSDEDGAGYEWCAEVYKRINGKRVRTAGSTIENMGTMKRWK